MFEVGLGYNFTSAIAFLLSIPVTTHIPTEIPEEKWIISKFANPSAEEDSILNSLSPTFRERFTVEGIDSYS